MAAGAIGVVVLSSLFAGEPDVPDLAPVPASPSASEQPPTGDFSYHLSYVDATAYEQGQADALQVCMALPGTHDELVHLSLPPQLSVIVTGTAEVEEFENCVGDIDNIEASRLPSPQEPTP